MKIELLPLTRLKPAPYNPRLALRPGMPAYQRLERSLDEFDLVQPIVWNRSTGHVVGGHQRLEVLRRRGIEQIECVVVELSLEREKALNVALNNDQVGGDWDPEKLVDLIAELRGLPDFDATLTGFDDKDLNTLLLEPQPLFDEPQEPGSDRVRVTLEVLPEDWDDVRGDLDDLLRKHREIQLHVQMPNR